MYIKSYQVGGGQVFTREYGVWNALNQRLQSKRYRNKTYKDCSMSESFKDFQLFAEWCNNQVGFREIEESTGTFWNLDKDILCKNNKLYSEHYCVFVPSALNKFLTLSNSARGIHPVGVDFYKRNNKYRARCSDGTKNTLHLGYFETSEEAFLVYKHKKEEIAKQLANTYLGKVDDRVVTALMEFSVSVED